MIKEILQNDLNERCVLNFERLKDEKYSNMCNVFMPADYDWYADMEGRALLAHISHKKISGKENPAMHEIVSLLPSRLNKKGYLGKIFDPQIHEQQLSGHSWLLRGLCEYYEQFGNAEVFDILNGILESLYFPLIGRFSDYPVERQFNEVGESMGKSVETNGGWILSSDVGCAFTSIDGLSHVYKLTNNPKIKVLLDEMVSVYLKIDKAKLKVQTHCTLTSARGMIRMYHLSGDEHYLEGAKSIYKLYVYGGGMTYTYHNLNFWNTPDCFTEPCAVIDSLMLCCELYKATENPEYRTIAARIYHNAFATIQRSNGGAGCDELVCDGGKDSLMTSFNYEAWWCCSMRMADGLWYALNHKDMLYAEYSGTVKKDAFGRYSDGDILYCEVNPEFAKYCDGFVKVDGHTLCPIPLFYKIPEEDAKKIKLKIIFD